MRRLRAGVPVLVATITTLAFPPLGLLWLAALLWRRVRTGSWGMTLAFLSRSGRRTYAWVAGLGLVAVCAAYASSLAGHGGADLAPVLATIVSLGLLALVALDAVFGATIVVADAATRASRGRRRPRR